MICTMSKDGTIDRFDADTMNEVAGWLYTISHAVEDLPTDTTDHEDEEPYCDVRLHISDDLCSYVVHSGDSSYDQDHRGYWGSGIVSQNMSWGACKELAAELCEQVADNHAECVL